MFNKPRLLTPGPTQLPERVRLAMAKDMIHHRKPEFKKIMESVQVGLQQLFGTSQPVLSLTASGTGAMDAAVCGLFAPNEKVLIVDAGKFAERWVEICTMHGIATTILSVPWGQGVNPADIAEALANDPTITGVLVQQSETSTGAQHPIKQIAAITRNKPVLLVVDGISAVSITPCPMEDWGIDCLVTGSQKGLMLPPGLALLALSERGWLKAETITPRNFYFNLVAERDNVVKNQTHFTSAVSLLVGLHESLTMFQEVGLQAIYQKQWALTQMVRTGISALGLTLFAKDHYAWGVTSILLPHGIDATQLLSIAQSRYGVIMAAGQGHLKNRMVRFGHMGWVDFGDISAGLYALAQSYEACGGFTACRDYLEQALDAYWTALNTPIAIR